MKSERRHKLQQNALAHSLENLPKMGRESGSKLLLGIVTVLLVIVLIRFYLQNRESKKERIAADLSIARSSLSELPRLPVEEQKKTLDDIDNRVHAVLGDATDGPSLAQANNILADAYVQMATLGNPPEATTRPELALPKKPDDMLDEAGRLYQSVLEIKEGLPVTEAANAHFGLGAIAENRREWDKARGQYQAVEGDPSMYKVFTDYAALRLEVLDRISKPLVKPTPVEELQLPPGLTSRPATNPTTGPTTTPSAGSATQPSTVSPMPSSGPAAAPTTNPATTGPTTTGA